MIIKETKPVKTWRGFNLTILKVNLNPIWKNWSCSTGLRPLTSYYYPPVETYWHDHVQAPKPRTLSFLDSPASTRLRPLWKNRSCSTGLRPLTSYCYPLVETYWHDHVQAPKPRTLSFLDSPASTSTPACVSLSSYGNNWMIIKLLKKSPSS